MSNYITQHDPLLPELGHNPVTESLASRSLFWAPRFVTENPFVYHLPLVFWLVDIMRPTRVVAVGMTDGQSYFGFCQAIDKLNIPAMCHGFGTWPMTDAEAVPVSILDHNDLNYSDFSIISNQSALATLKSVTSETLDTLVVNMAADLGDCGLFFDLAKRKMSHSGMIVLHDLDAVEHGTDKAVNLQNLREAYPHFQSGEGATGVLVILTGTEHDERLRSFAAMTVGTIPYNTVQTIFRRLGAGHYHTWRSKRAALDIRAAKDSADVAVAERDEIRREHAALVALHARTVQEHVEIVTDLNRKSENQVVPIAISSTPLTAPENLPFRQEVNAARKALELQLQTRFQELAILQREIAAVEKRADDRIRKIHNSTSWRVTAPMRAVISKIRRRKKS